MQYKPYSRLINVFANFLETIAKVDTIGFSRVRQIYVRTYRGLIDSR